MKKINPKWIDLYRAAHELLKSANATVDCLKKLHLSRRKVKGRSFMNEHPLIIRSIADEAAYLDLTLEITISEMVGGDISDLRTLLGEDGAD